MQEDSSFSISVMIGWAIGWKHAKILLYLQKMLCLQRAYDISV